jgi:hypothetical protein
MSCCLISLETSGNQAYVYSTNKLRDVVGASELIYRVGTSFVQEAVEIVTSRYPYLESIATDEPVIERDSKSGTRVIEVVIATSGKAVLLADSTGTAKEFITAWSEIVTERAPSMDALAVYSEIEIDMAKPLDDPAGLIAAFKDAGKNFSVLKSSRAFEASRFQRVPITAPCVFSGLPAETIVDNNHPASRITGAKINARNSLDFERRMNGLFGDTKHSAQGDGLERLEGLDWIAVVHADGNGLGQVFTNLDRLVINLIESTESRNANGRDYVDCYRKFSNALDRISKNAFRETIEEMFGSNGFAYIVPIVVGGDDLTVVTDGRKAIEFTKTYMEKFCEMTGSEDEISNILEQRMDGTSRLGMCAGVSVTKPHFPFSASYGLAEKLMHEAKKVKTIGSDCIAIDFHILYDSIATSLKDIRRKLTAVSERLCRTAKPYVIYLGGHNNGSWRAAHSYRRFENAVNALGTKEHDGTAKRILPSSQAHAIRDSLFSESRITQEAEWKYLMGKKEYKEFADEWEKAMGNQKELYLSADFGDNAPNYYTYFLDALEAAEFLEGRGTLTTGGGEHE